MKEQEQESESESDSEVLCTDSTALVQMETVLLEILVHC
jgi:hypothetical protein